MKFNRIVEDVLDVENDLKKQIKKVYTAPPLNYSWLNNNTETQYGVSHILARRLLSDNEFDSYFYSSAVKKRNFEVGIKKEGDEEGYSDTYYFTYNLFPVLNSTKKEHIDHILQADFSPFILKYNSISTFSEDADVVMNSVHTQYVKDCVSLYNDFISTSGSLTLKFLSAFQRSPGVRTKLTDEELHEFRVQYMDPTDLDNLEDFASIL